MSTQSDYVKIRKQTDKAKDAGKQAADVQKAKDAAKKRLDTLKGDIDKLNGLVNVGKSRGKTLQADLTDAQKAFISYVKATSGPGHPTPSEQTQRNTLENAVNSYENAIKDNNKMITEWNKTIADKVSQEQVQTNILNSKDGKYHDPNSGKPKSKKPEKPGSKKTVVSGSNDTHLYKYNVQMASESYFSPFGLQAKELTNSGFHVDPGVYSDARNAWKGTGGRGTIQMDAKYAAAQAVENLYTAKQDVPNYDPNLYGFKFLYNPTTVGMAWGVQTETVPSFEASGQDLVNPIASGLVTSTLSFTLMLNRIPDMKYLDKTGLKPFKIDPGLNIFQEAVEWTQYASINTAQVTHMLDKKQPANRTNPYPDGTPEEELIEIYNRGTMYDMEYLFRTIMGPHGKFYSSLNGWTADKGWLRPTIVEVHLGDGLRYRARITELSINHAVFDARMVPILSSVNITMARFNDYQNVDYGQTGKTPKN